MVSALSLSGFEKRMVAHPSYKALVEIDRARFTASTETLRELFARMTSNILLATLPTVPAITSLSGVATVSRS